MSATGRASGKVIIVTGGARGIGAAHVRRLEEEGARVAITDVLEAEGQALAAEFDGDVLFIKHDVRSADQWRDVITQTERRFGPVTALINNAGIIDGGPIETFGEAAYRAIIDINQVGTYLGMQAAIPSLRRAGGGSIVNCSSIQGLAGVPGLAAYVASKFAITGMTKVAALELAKDNIRVNSIHPGLIATSMTDGLSAPVDQPIRRLGTPEEVASLALYLISDEASFCTGSEFVVDGGILNTALIFGDG